jgi:hypothetical protein
MLTLIVVSSSAFGDKASKDAKRKELMELRGMVKIMEQSRNRNKVRALQHKNQILWLLFKSSDRGLFYYLNVRKMFYTTEQPRQPK